MFPCSWVRYWPSAFSYILSLLGANTARVSTCLQRIIWNLIRINRLACPLLAQPARACPVTSVASVDISGRVFTFVALARLGTRRSLVIANIEPIVNLRGATHLLTTRWLLSSDWAARVSWLIQAATSRGLTLHTTTQHRSPRWCCGIGPGRQRGESIIANRGLWNVQLAPLI
jgi:TctA family transporter